MVTLSSCLIWQITSFILPPNKYSFVYAWTTLRIGPSIDLQSCRFWQEKSAFQMKLILILIAFGAQKTLTHTFKSRCTKTSHCLVRILVQKHNWTIFLRKWASRGRYSQRPSLSGHVERIFVYKNWRGGYWQHLVSTGRHYVPHSRSYTRCFVTCFWKSHYQQQSWCC